MREKIHIRGMTGAGFSSSQQRVQVLCYTPPKVRKRIFTLIFMLGFVSAAFSVAFAGAPECINHIAVNGELLEGDGFFGSVGLLLYRLRELARRVH